MKRAFDRPIIVLAVTVAAVTAGVYGVLALVTGAAIGYTILAKPDFDQATAVADELRESAKQWKRLYYEELSKGVSKDE